MKASNFVTMSKRELKTSRKLGAVETDALSHLVN